MCDLARLRDQLQQDVDDFRACLLASIVGCCGFLVIGLAAWLFEGRNRVHEAARRATEPCAEPLAPQIHRRRPLPAAVVPTEAQAPERSPRRSAAPLTPRKQSAPRALAAPRQIASNLPPAPRPGSAETEGSPKRARTASASTSKTPLLGATKLTASTTPWQRSSVSSPPTTGRRRGVPSGDDSSTRRLKRQSSVSVSSGSRFYAEVVSRQVAAHRLGSKGSATAALAQDLPPLAARIASSATF